MIAACLHLDKVLSLWEKKRVVIQADGKGLEAGHSRCFVSNILGLFDIFSLIYVFRSLQLSVTIGREWSSVMQEPLTRRKKWKVSKSMKYRGYSKPSNSKGNSFPK